MEKFRSNTYEHRMSHNICPLYDDKNLLRITQFFLFSFLNVVQMKILFVMKKNLLKNVLHERNLTFFKSYTKNLYHYYHMKINVIQRIKIYKMQLKIYDALTHLTHKSIYIHINFVKRLIYSHVI